MCMGASIGNAASREVHDDGARFVSSVAPLCEEILYP